MEVFQFPKGIGIIENGLWRFIFRANRYGREWYLPYRCRFLRKTYYNRIIIPFIPDIHNQGSTSVN